MCNIFFIDTDLVANYVRSAVGKIWLLTLIYVRHSNISSFKTKEIRLRPFCVIQCVVRFNCLLHPHKDQLNGYKSNIRGFLSNLF